MAKRPSPALRLAGLTSCLVAAARWAPAGDFAEKVISGEALTLGDLFEAGGLIMWVLVVLSVLAVGTAAYLFAVLRESTVAPPALSARLLELLRAGEADAAAGLVTSGGNPLARITRAGFRRAESGSAEVAPAVEGAGRREIAHLRTTVNYLSNVGVIAPMLGLLGTVIGMIQAFGSIAGEEIRVVPLAAAIMKAMVTTAFGLMVGILALALFYLFRGRLAAVAAELESLTEEIASLIGGSPRKETIPEVTEVAEELPNGNGEDEAAAVAAASAEDAPGEPTPGDDPAEESGDGPGDGSGRD